MPLYEYECGACGHRFEVIQKFSDGPVESCPSCGRGPVRKLLSSPAIQFKGSGWYVTDYARKESTPAKGETKTESKAETKAETKTETKAETKTETKSESKTETKT
jgi:putative FmdB family regulatory protein